MIYDQKGSTVVTAAKTAYDLRYAQSRAQPIDDRRPAGRVEPDEAPRRATPGTTLVGGANPVVEVVGVAGLGTPTTACAVFTT